MPSAKAEHEVIVPHTWEDPKTGKTTKFKVGDDYTGGDVEKCLAGVDHHGPLIRRKTPAPAASETKER